MPLSTAVVINEPTESVKAEQLKRMLSRGQTTETKSEIVDLASVILIISAPIVEQRHLPLVTLSLFQMRSTIRTVSRPKRMQLATV